MNENLNSVGIVANRLVDAWLDIMSANSASQVRLAEDNKEAVLNFAKELDIRDEVMDMANKIWKGEN